MEKYKLLVQTIATLLLVFEYCHSSVSNLVDVGPSTTASTYTRTINLNETLSKQQASQQTISKQQQQQQSEYDRPKGTNNNQFHDSLIGEHKLNQNLNNNSRKINDCEYDKGAWEDCKSNGKF